jgi:hypothetical protein
LPVLDENLKERFLKEQFLKEQFFKEQPRPITVCKVGVENKLMTQQAESKETHFNF